MARIGTLFNVIDNSGILLVLCVGNLSSFSKIIKIGSILVCVVKKLASKISGKKLNTIVYGVVVQTKIGEQDKYGNFYCFNNNSVVLIDKNLNPISSRIFGVIPIKLKFKNFLKLNSLVSEII